MSTGAIGNTSATQPYDPYAFSYEGDYVIVPGLSLVSKVMEETGLSLRRLKALNSEMQFNSEECLIGGMIRIK